MDPMDLINANFARMDSKLDYLVKEVSNLKFRASFWGAVAGAASTLLWLFLR